MDKLIVVLGRFVDKKRKKAKAEKEMEVRLRKVEEGIDVIRARNENILKLQSEGIFGGLIEKNERLFQRLNAGDVLWEMEGLMILFQRGDMKPRDFQRVMKERISTTSVYRVKLAVNEYRGNDVERMEMLLNRLGLN